MVSEILLTLKSLHYSGNRKNFNFDKFCTDYVDQHNCHAALSKHGVAPHEETMNIHYFKDRVTDLSFASVKSTIMVDYGKFQEFDTVMWLYINYKCMQKAEAPTHQARNVSALQGCRGGRQGRGGCGRSGRGGPDAGSKGIVPQEEVDKVTTVKARLYPHFEYNKFIPAKKQKHYQLMKKSNTTGKGSATVAELMSTVSVVFAAASAISELTATTNNKRIADVGETNDDDAAANSKWGHKRNNPIVAGCQECMPKKPKT